MTILEQFVQELRPITPPSLKSKLGLLFSYLRGEAMGESEQKQSRFLFVYLFNLSSRAAVMTYSYRSIAKWKRQLFIPAVIEWYTVKRDQFEAQNARLQVVKDEWLKFVKKETPDAERPESTGVPVSELSTAG